MPVLKTTANGTGQLTTNPPPGERGPAYVRKQITISLENGWKHLSALVLGPLAVHEAVEKKEVVEVESAKSGEESTESMQPAALEIGRDASTTPTGPSSPQPSSNNLRVLWAVTSLTTGLLVVKVSTQESAKKIAEHLWRSCRECFNYKSAEEIMKSLEERAPWAKPWLIQCREAKAYIPPMEKEPEGCQKQE